jgi:hypothetical protein
LRCAVFVAVGQLRKAGKNAAHLRITLDHLGCPARETMGKNAAFRRLPLAAEGYCIHAKCRHRPAGGVLRSFEARTGPLTAQSVSGAQCTLFAPPLWPEIRPQ